MRVVCDKLGTVSQLWRQIGVQLGIPRHMLEQLEGTKDPLGGVVDCWLKGNAGEQAVPKTWKSVAAALRSPHVGKPALANEIEREFCQSGDTKAEEGYDYCVKVKGNVSYYYAFTDSRLVVGDQEENNECEQGQRHLQCMS